MNNTIYGGTTATPVPITSVDPTYNPTSDNAQSGKAVAEAVDANKQYANNTFSAAIKNTVSGLVVSANDVSPIEHNLGVKVSSKNLFDIDKVLNTDNWYYNGGSISYPLNLISGRMYTFSIENLQTFTDNFAIVRKANVSLWEHTVLFAINGKVGKLTYSFVADGTECLWIYAGGIGNAAAFQTRINNILLNYTKSLQLELGDTATEYTPYVEPSTVTVKRLGETYTEYEPYIEPQTAVANADGTVTGLTSISPNMTIMTDNNGVTLNVTYNVDTKTYIDDKSTPAKFTKVYESGEIRSSVDEYGDYISAFHSVENLNLTKCLIVVESTNEENGYTLDTAISIDVNNRSFNPYFEPKSYGKLIIDCDVEDGILRAKHWINDDSMWEHTSVVDMSAQNGVIFADKINKIAIELWSNFKFTIYGR